MPNLIAASLCLLLGSFLPPGLRAADASTKPPSFNSSTTSLPYRATWGPYLVSVEATAADQRDAAKRLIISDHAGHVLKEVNAYYIDSVDYPYLDGPADPEQLRVTTAPANNLLSNRRTYCFTRLGKLRNTLAMSGSIDELRYLDGNARPELLSDNWAPLEYAEGVDLCHAAYPPVYLVLRWKDWHYSIANSQFPAVVLAQVEQKKKIFLKHVKKFQNPQSESLSGDYLVGEAIGIYADLGSVGQSDSGRRWLLEHLPTGFLQRQFSESLPCLKKALAKLPRLVTTNQSHIINAPE